MIKGNERTGDASVAHGPRRFALIIGAMKSGTTSLFDLLAQHPEISPCGVKEPNFFGAHPQPREAWDDYVALWDWSPEKHKVALEASVSYAKAPWVPDVPRRIRSMSEIDFKFIYVMRHPLRRIESQIRHSLFEGWGTSLDEGMTQDLLDFSRYATQADQYLKYFPRGSLLILTLDELRDSPSRTLRRCCRFLGVAEDFIFQGETERRNTGDFYGVPPVVGALARSRGVRSLARRLLPRQIHHKLRAFLGRKLTSEASLGRWQLNAVEEAKVLEELAPEFRRLEDDFGIDVERVWSIPTSRIER